MDIRIRWSGRTSRTAQYPPVIPVAVPLGHVRVTPQFQCHMDVPEAGPQRPLLRSCVEEAATALVFAAWLELTRLLEGGEELSGVGLRHTG